MNSSYIQVVRSIKEICSWGLSHSVHALHIYCCSSEMGTNNEATESPANCHFTSFFLLSSKSTTEKKNYSHYSSWYLLNFVPVLQKFSFNI